MPLAWGDLFYSINLRAVTLSPAVIGMLSLSVPPYVEGDTIYCNLNSVLYHSLDWQVPDFSLLDDLEEASLMVFWNTVSSLSIIHANVWCLVEAVADRTKTLSRFWIDSALCRPVCPLLYEWSMKGHSK